MNMLNKMRASLLNTYHCQLVTFLTVCLSVSVCVSQGVCVCKDPSKMTKTSF